MSLTEFLKWASALHVATGKAALPTNFFARVGSAQTFASNAIFPLHFDTLDYDNGGFFNGGSHQYNPQIAGVYSFALQLGVSLPADTGGAVRSVLFLNGNGGTLLGVTPYIPLEAGKVAVIPPLVLNAQMNGDTDYMQAYIQFNAYPGTDMAIDNATYTTYFQGFRAK